MKVLKSGIEMTPKQMEKSKGGACACGCNSSGMGLNSMADDSGICGCSCFGMNAFTESGMTIGSRI